MISVKAFEFNYFAVNTYILYDETKSAVIIDCGCFRREEERELKEFVKEYELTLEHLLCTHLHLDHVFGNDFIGRAYGLSPRAHKSDVDMLPTPQEQAKMFGIQDKIKPAPITSYLVSNEVIKFGASEIVVSLVPGHSPGSVIFHSRKDGIAIVGDTIFNGSIGRTDLWCGNQDMLVAAIKDKILSFPDETILYPGHGPITHVLDERLNNPFL